MKRLLWIALAMCASWLLLAASGAGALAPAAAAVPPASPTAQPGAPQAPAEAPYALVPSGANAFTLDEPKLFWYSLDACTQIIHTPAAPAAPSAPNATLYETVQRIATYGGLPRELWQHQVNFYCPSGNDVVSNIVTDGSYLYWMSSIHSGVVKLSVDANFGDKPTVVSKAVAGQAQLALAQGLLFVLTQPGAGNSILWSVDPGSGAATNLADTGALDSNFQTDGGYLYWLNGSSTLEQWDIHYTGFGSLAGGVTGYFPAINYRSVFVAQGKSIVQINYIDNTTTPIYTSADSTNTVYDLALANGNLFWFEDHPIPCGSLCFESHNDLLIRAGADGSSPNQIYVYSAGLNPQANGLRADSADLFWLEGSAIQRLPQNAAALPKINLVADNLEVTQGIQDLSQDVTLINNRDTYVRFYVHSAGAAVPGVTAWLYEVDGGGEVIAGPLLPVNPAGTALTVQSSPDRNNLNDSFLFELPYSWTNFGPPLHLRVVMNPNQYPLEPNYSDNTLNKTVAFLPSPRIVVYFISWGYILNNQIWFPRYIKDMTQTWSWVRRAYPVSSDPGMLSDPTPGFRPNLWTILDGGLGSRVDQSDSSCSNNECASAYTNSLMQAMRVENGIPDAIFMYGMISDAAGIFPRGQACCGTAVSTGPAGSGTWGWDTDGSYADWYAGHEIGHTLGRQHPWKGSSVDDNKCGQTPSDGSLDTSYPWKDGQIGPNSGGRSSLEGFDVGDASLGLPLRIYPDVSWYDVMSYCGNQWISDYNYTGIYNYALAHPSPLGPAAAPQANLPQADLPQQPSINGNWLAVYGNIVTAAADVAAHVPGLANTANSAIINRLRHLGTVASVPPRVSGPYSIELFDSGSHLLASYPFTPGPASPDADTWLPFTQVVTDVANTAQLRIVQLAGNVTLATKNIPASGPTISNVHLVGAPNPVNGTVTLQWTAGDALGNPLSFDIFYSRDGGATVQPLIVGVGGSSTSIDTTALGGSGTAVLRVVASDGVNTAQADSAPFTMANKPPQPQILTPADGTHRHYGQLINFSGQALDAQDVGVDGSGLVWRDKSGVLGTGALLSVADLPIGADVITLTATDKAALSASAHITVYVDDSLSLPGPTLSAGPTQFAFAFTSNAAPAQTALLHLDNAGSGSLSWTASSDAPWLQLNHASGAAPDTITLTIDPSGLQNDTSHAGHVLLHAPAQGGSPAQDLSIPVGVDVGGTASAPALWANHLYLPLVGR